MRTFRLLLSALDLADFISVCGVAALLYGVAQWSVPGAWVLSGLLLIAVAIGANWRKERR